MTIAKPTTTRPAAAKTADGKPAPFAAANTARKPPKPAGKALIGAKATQTDPAAMSAAHPAGSPSPRRTKAAILRARLTEPGGVSLASLMETTGWQAHTLRAALSGLRKTGVTLTRRREGDDTIYAIATTKELARDTIRNGDGGSAGRGETLSATGDATAHADAAAQDLQSVPTTEADA